MRFSPFSGKRPPRYSEVRTIRNVEMGQEDTLTLLHLDTPLAHLAADVGNRLVQQYVGDPESNIAPEMEFPDVDGLPVEMSASLCTTVGNLYVMQGERPDGGAIYTPEELIALTVTSPSAWSALKEAANEVNREGDKRKNGLRAPDGSGSGTPSDTTSPIPNSPPEATPS